MVVLRSAVALAAVVLASATAAPGQQTVCKSTDARGTITYADCPPPATYRPVQPRPAPEVDVPPPSPSPPIQAGPAAAAPTASPNAIDLLRDRLLPRAMSTREAMSTTTTRLIKPIAGHRPTLIAGVGLMILGFAVNLVTSVQYLSRAFRVGVWWGLGCLFVAPVNLLFMVLHWRIAKQPVLVSLLGTALLVVGLVIAKGL